MKRESCPICSSPEISVALHEVRDYITGEKFDVLHCGSCEVSFTYPQPKNMDKYYPARYRRYNKAILAILKALYRYQVNRWERLFQKPGFALEIGCCDGLMLDALRKNGWGVAGTERTQEMAEFARKNLGLEVYVGGFEEIPRSKRFDLVILFQVLEHMNDPVKILKQCAGVLNSNGKIVIAVPNSGSWQYAYATSNWFHLDVPRHLFHFSPKSLGNTLHRAGLEVSSVSFVSFEHDPYGWIQSILNKQWNNRNVLTRQLMNLDSTTWSSIAFILIGVLWAIPSLLLSMVSWGAHRGAIMQIVSSRRV
ncbi:MAG: methyltransferase [Bacteroidetes bacterium]|nr:methyltransferase [Bacteroidota bacterium]